MKYTFLLLLAFASLFSITSCNTDGEERFEIPITIPNFTVSEFNGTQKWQVFNNQQITTQIESQLNAFGFSLDNVKKIEPKSIKLYINTSGATFDGISIIDSYVKADGVDSIKIAYSSEIPAGVDSLVLNSQYSDISPVLRKPSFTFLVRAFNTDSFGPVEGSVVLTVDVIAEK